MTREQQPNLPITPAELARDAAECAAAGASIYHLHVRDEAGAPTMDVDTFRRGREAIAAETDLIVQFTTGGGVGDDVGSRVAPLRLRPEMATLTTGSVNFGDDVFLNPAPLIERLYLEMRAVGTLPEYEIFEAGMIANAKSLYDRLGDGHHQHFDLVLGVAGALPAGEGVIPFLVERLPPDATWSATGIGRAHFAVVEEAITYGGHVRTGFEDVRYLGAGRPARSNAELVRHVAEIAEQRGRVVATPDQTRTLLELNAL